MKVLIQKRIPFYCKFCVPDPVLTSGLTLDIYSVMSTVIGKKGTVLFKPRFINRDPLSNHEKSLEKKGIVINMWTD